MDSWHFRWTFGSNSDPQHSSEVPGWRLLRRWASRVETSVGNWMERAFFTGNGCWKTNPWRILTVLLYMVLHGSPQEIPPINVSIFLPAPWIRHGWWNWGNRRHPRCNSSWNTVRPAVPSQARCCFCHGPATKSDAMCPSSGRIRRCGSGCDVRLKFFLVQDVQLPSSPAWHIWACFQPVVAIADT